MVHTHSESIEIRAAPDDVYDLIATVEAAPELSKEVRRVEWLSDVRGPVVGARFRGRNRYLGFGWWREVKVTVADRGHEFAFQTVRERGIKNDSTTWRFVLLPTDTGTLVTQSYDHDAPQWLEWMDRLLGRRIALAARMRGTLIRIARRVESRDS